MKARLTVAVALAAGVTLTSVAAAGPEAAKQRLTRDDLHVDRYPRSCSPRYGTLG